jgi:hypothetical protein
MLNSIDSDSVHIPFINSAHFCDTKSAHSITNHVKASCLFEASGKQKKYDAKNSNETIMYIILLIIVL